MSSPVAIQGGTAVVVAVHTDVAEVFFPHVVPARSKKPVSDGDAAGRTSKRVSVGGPTSLTLAL
ncbi:hypothetical protein [Streptomyces sp. NPDC058335]|uniref:hypothetical protein n=1 Tax=Streptomyces sp. NPDC058335 TaxID=3346451 RepID=UPI0036556097